MFGGSKTTKYYIRNDKPFEAKLEGKLIQLRGQEGHINATIKGEKLYDLTEKGVHLFYIIGKKAYEENRMFSNFATQGVEGVSHRAEKILRTNLMDLQELNRPMQLEGSMKLDGVKWEKKRTEINGIFENKVRKARSWTRTWEHQSISPAAMIVVGIAASVAGANLIAPLFINSSMSALQVAMIKTCFATLTSRFSVSLVGSGGDFGKAFEQFLSINTVRALAFNMATTGLCQHFEIKNSLTDAAKQTSFKNIFNEHVIKNAISIPLSAVIYGNFPQNLSDFIKPFIVDVFGHYAASEIGLKYSLETIDSVTHKALHGLVGAIGGFIIDGSLKGAAGGALSAVIAEVVLEALETKQETEKKMKAFKEALAKGGSVECLSLLQSSP